MVSSAYLIASPYPAVPPSLLPCNPVAAVELSQVCSKILIPNHTLPLPSVRPRAQGRDSGIVSETRQTETIFQPLPCARRSLCSNDQRNPRCHLNERPPVVLVSVPPSGITFEYWLMPILPLWEHKVLNITKMHILQKEFEIHVLLLRMCVTKYKSGFWGRYYRGEGSWKVWGLLQESWDKRRRRAQGGSDWRIPKRNFFTASIPWMASSVHLLLP